MLLTWILAVAAVICLAYYAVILIYAGIATSFAAVWFLFAAFLGCSAASVYRYQRFPEKMHLRIPVTFVTLCVAGIVIMLILQILIFVRVPRTAQPDLDYVIVLGAKVRPDKAISKTLKLRLDKAAEYARENPETKLILSGGKSGNEPICEAEAMAAYLIGAGVPKEQMLLELQSKSTLENVVFSRDLIRQCLKEERERELQKQELLGINNYDEFEGPGLRSARSDSGFEHPVHVGVLTSNFHLYRAMLIAKKHGLRHAAGIAAPSDPILLIHMAFRDALAVLKDRLAGNL